MIDIKLNWIILLLSIIVFSMAITMVFNLIIGFITLSIGLFILALLTNGEITFG